MERTATCHWGQLRVIATGEPARVYLCHCKACQRQSGSVVHSGASWLKNQVRIEGEHKIYARKGDSGFEVRCYFCPNCGSNVFSETDRAPEYCGIPVGCFADPDFPPADRLDLGRIDAWLARPSHGDRPFSAGPPDRWRTLNGIAANLSNL